MKTSSLFAAIALTFAAASGPVFAQEASYDYPQVTTSQTSRTSVLAELQQARAEGSAQVSEAGTGNEVRLLPSTSRDFVRAQARQAQLDGYTAALIAEPQGFTVAASAGPAAVTLAAR